MYVVCAWTEVRDAEIRTWVITRERRISGIVVLQRHLE